MASEGTTFAQYTCDSCYAKKTGCSKEKPSCATCRQSSTPCTYSRAGVIHRRPKRKRNHDSAPNSLPEDHQRSPDPPNRQAETSSMPHNNPDVVPRLQAMEDKMAMLTSSLDKLQETINGSNVSVVPPPPNIAYGEKAPATPRGNSCATAGARTGAPARAVSQQAADRERMETHLGGSNDNSTHRKNAFQGLSSLAAAYTEFWRDPDFVRLAQSQGELGSSFFSFEGRYDMLEIFENVLGKAKPFFSDLPGQIRGKLLDKPWEIEDRAWLVIFYGIVMTSKQFEKSEVEQKLKWNLCSAINNASLLLEPSELHIQALVLLGCHVEGFHTPSMCWMLISTACKMFQALYSSAPALRKEFEHMDTMFFALNFNDKSMALLFGRPPNFFGSTYTNYPAPSLEKMNLYRPHAPPSHESRPSSDYVFGGQYFLATRLLADIMDAMWRVLYDAEYTKETRESVGHSLVSWHSTTRRNLEQARRKEESFSSRKAVASMDLGIVSMDFQFYYLDVVLRRSSGEEQTYIGSARKALSILPQLVSDSTEAYNGVVWELLYYPFTPFFIVFEGITKSQNRQEREQDLKLLRRTLVYYQDMSKLHPQAENLRTTVIAFVKLADASMRNKIKTKSAQSLGTTSQTPKRTGEHATSTSEGHTNIARPLPWSSGMQGDTKSTTRPSVSIPLLSRGWQAFEPPVDDASFDHGLHAIDFDLTDLGRGYQRPVEPRASRASDLYVYAALNESDPTSYAMPSRGNDRGHDYYHSSHDHNHSHATAGHRLTDGGNALASTIEADSAAASGGGGSGTMDSASASGRRTRSHARTGGYGRSDGGTDIDTGTGAKPLATSNLRDGSLDHANGISDDVTPSSTGTSSGILRPVAQVRQRQVQVPHVDPAHFSTGMGATTESTGTFDTNHTSTSNLLAGGDYSHPTTAVVTDGNSTVGVDSPDIDGNVAVALHASPRTVSTTSTAATAGTIADTGIGTSAGAGAGAGADAGTTDMDHSERAVSARQGRGQGHDQEGENNTDVFGGLVLEEGVEMGGLFGDLGLGVAALNYYNDQGALDWFTWEFWDPGRCMDQ